MSIREELNELSMRSQRLATKALEAHKLAFEKWPHGDIVKVWIEDKALCIEYESGAWFHYIPNGMNCNESCNWIYWQTLIDCQLNVAYAHATVKTPYYIQLMDA